MFKYNRAKQRSEFFEQKYAEAQKEVENCKAQISNNFKQIQLKEEEVEREARLK